MVLKHLARAIREQNGFSVVLDVAIVVVGIVFGLQVSHWHERNAERDSDQQALARFADRLQLMREEARGALAFVTASQRDLSAAMEI